jgi:hypothetical protein
VTTTKPERSLDGGYYPASVEMLSFMRLYPVCRTRNRPVCAPAAGGVRLPSAPGADRPRTLALPRPSSIMQRSGPSTPRRSATGLAAGPSPSSPRHPSLSSVCLLPLLSTRRQCRGHHNVLPLCHRIHGDRTQGPAVPATVLVSAAVAFSYCRSQFCKTDFRQSVRRTGRDDGQV